MKTTLSLLILLVILLTTQTVMAQKYYVSSAETYISSNSFQTNVQENLSNYEGRCDAASETYENEYSVEIKSEGSRGYIVVKNISSGKTEYQSTDRFQFPEDYSAVRNFDFDKDGNEETVCFGYTGGNMGYVEIIIFDFQISIKPLCSIMTTSNLENLLSEEIFIDNGNYINILSVLPCGSGAEHRHFIYALKYSNGIITVDKDCSNTVFINKQNERIITLTEAAHENLNRNCKEEPIKYPVKALYLQYKLVNNIDDAIETFNKYYHCNDKQKFLNYTDEYYNKLISQENYIYKE